MEDFRAESGNDTQAGHLLIDYRQAAFPAEDRALCDYAVKLTLHPRDVCEGDITQLQNLGFSSQSITVAAQVISYFNYINRMADGLGVDAEPWMGKLDPGEWRRTKADLSQDGSSVPMTQGKST